jgi:hypothetical protein
MGVVPYAVGKHLIYSGNGLSQQTIGCRLVKAAELSLKTSFRFVTVLTVAIITKAIKTLKSGLSRPMGNEKQCKSFREYKLSSLLCGVVSLDWWQSVNTYEIGCKEIWAGV